jgi:hypothetical protein
MLKFILALLVITGSALAQQGNPPGVTPVPATLDSPLYLRAEKIWGTFPGHASTVELLPYAPILSTPTNLAQVVGCDCAAFTSASAIPFITNSIRLTTTLPGWDGSSPVYATITCSTCSNEPNHSVNFSLRAGAVANGANLSNPTFGGYQYVTNTIPAAYALSQSSFAPLAIGNSGASNALVVFELARLTDSFTNGVAVGSLMVSYAKNAF